MIKNLLDKNLAEMITTTKALQETFKIQPITDDIREDKLRQLEEFVNAHKVGNRCCNRYRFYHQLNLPNQTMAPASSLDPCKP